MAVIREKRNFRVGPIGVARADEGGRIVGEAIAQAANQSADIFFREGLRAAERVGEEAGQAADAGAVLTINPQTGQPEAYTPPAPFGTAAAEAYQRVVQRRFEQSMDDEMRTKSAELSARYENNPNGAALYESAMSDYIAAMSENATGQFQGYIADTGASYLNLTRSSMAINQMRRERAAAAAAQAEAAAEANRSIGQLVEQYGPAFLETSFFENMAESSRVTVSDGISSNLFDPTASSSNERELNAEIATGIISYTARNARTVRDANSLNQAIQLADPNLVPEGYEGVAQMIRDSFSDPNLQDAMRTVSRQRFSASIANLSPIEEDQRIMMEQLAEDARALASGEIAMGDILRQRREAQAELDEEQRQADIRADQELRTQEAGRTSNDIEMLASNTNYSGLDIARQAIAFINRGQENLVTLAGTVGVEDSYIENERKIQQTVLVNGYISGLQQRVVQQLDGTSLTTEELQSVQNAIQSGNFVGLPSHIQDALSGLRLISMEVSDEVFNFEESMDGFINSVKSGAANVTERDILRQANNQVEFDLNPMIDDIATSGNFADLLGNIRTAQDFLGQINHPNDDVRASLSRDIDWATSKAMVSLAFPNIAESSFALNEAERVLTEGLAEGEISDILGPTVSQFLNEARQFAGSAGMERSILTYFGDRREQVEERIALAEQETARAQTFSQVINFGQGDPSNADHREVVTNYLGREYGLIIEQNGYNNLSEVFSDPNFFSNPIFRPIIEDINRIGVAPEPMITVMQSVANGNVRPENLQAALSIWTNMSVYNTPSGANIYNPIFNEFNETEKAVFNHIASSAQMMSSSTESIIEGLRLMRSLDNDETYKTQVEAFFGDRTPEEFVMEVIQTEIRDSDIPLSTSQVSALGTAALYMSAYGAGSSSLSDIERDLVRHVNMTFPDGGGFIVDQMGQSRARTSLSTFAGPSGNEQVVRNFFRMQARDALDRDGNRLGSNIVFGKNTFARDDQTRVFLQEVGIPTSGLSQVVLMIDRPLEEGGPYQANQIFQQTDFEGEPFTAIAPMIIGNDDPILRNMLEERARIDNARKRSAAESLVLPVIGTPDEEPIGGVYP